MPKPAHILEASPAIERYLAAVPVTSDRIGRILYVADGEPPHAHYCEVTPACTCGRAEAIEWAKSEAVTLILLDEK